MEQKRSTELEYLQYIYNSLSWDDVITLHKRFPKTPPDKYSLLLCKDCELDLAGNVCFLCTKFLCNDCTYYCDHYKVNLCEDHFVLCPICEVGCACRKCCKYMTDNICTTCTETMPYGVHCGCLEQTEKECCICDNKMDPVTKELL